MCRRSLVSRRLANPLIFAVSAAITLAGVACGDTSSGSPDGASGSGGPGAPDGAAGISPDGASAAPGPDGGNGAPDAASPPVTIARAMSDDLVGAPQYLVVRKSPTEGIEAGEKARCVALLPGLAALPFYGNSHSCVIFNRGIVTAIPDTATRRAVLAQGFEEVRKVVGGQRAGDRQLAVEVILWDLLNGDPASSATYVADVLAAAKASKVPVYVDLDAVDWWEGRPDLWNFFDPAAKGYSAANVANVEWIGATSDGAPRVYWRDWGAQFRVDSPIPNLASKGVRAAIALSLDAVAKPIVEFELGLAPDERYLFAGVSIGTEISLGVNHYYYPSGNLHAGKPGKCDPGVAFDASCGAPQGGACPQYNDGLCPPDFSKSPSGGVQEIGFHAALDLGLVAAGAPLTQGIRDRVVVDYLTFLAADLARRGLPPAKVFAHTGGVFGPNGPHTLAAAEAPGVVPGWSIYFAPSPATFASAFFADADRRAYGWSTSEWLPLDPGAAAAEWRNAIESTLGYYNNRLASLANWESVARASAVTSALGGALTAPPAGACTVVPREVLGAATLTDGVHLRFTRAREGTVTYFNASSKPDLTVHGTLATIDAANAALGAETSHVLGLGAGHVSAQLVIDGCAAGGDAKRVLSEVVSIDTGAPPSPPGVGMLYASTALAPRRASYVRFAWDAPSGGGAIHLQISTHATFDVADVADEVVTGKDVFVRDGFRPGVTHYARLSSSGGASNVITFVP